MPAKAGISLANKKEIPGQAGEDIGEKMISISRDNYQKILAHAEKNLPEEACGLIAGEVTAEGKVIREVYLLTNIDHSNEHFSLDPKEHLAAIKDIRAKGLKPLGNWHSHPESPSRPSQEDKRPRLWKMARTA